MKCSNCGSNEFFTHHLQGPTDDGWWHSDEVIPFVCAKCGHIEFFVDEKIVKRHNDSIKAEKERAIKKAKIIEEIEAAKKRIDLLIPITKDENKTVKEVRDAQNEINRLNTNLKNLNSDLSTLNIIKSSSNSKLVY